MYSLFTSGFRNVATGCKKKLPSSLLTGPRWWPQWPAAQPGLCQSVVQSPPDLGETVGTYYSHSLCMVLYFSIYTISRRHTAYWFNDHICYKMLAMIIIVTICHYTKLLQDHWLYILYAAFFIPVTYFIIKSLFVFIPFTSFAHLQPLPGWCYYPISL